MKDEEICRIKEALKMFDLHFRVTTQKFREIYSTRDSLLIFRSPNKTPSQHYTSLEHKYLYDGLEQFFFIIHCRLFAETFMKIN